MHNYLLLLLALLRKHALITSDDASALAEEIESMTLPDSYEAAEEAVDDLYKRLDIKIPKAN